MDALKKGELASTRLLSHPGEKGAGQRSTARYLYLSYRPSRTSNVFLYFIYTRLSLP